MRKGLWLSLLLASASVAAQNPAGTAYSSDHHWPEAGKYPVPDAP